MPNAKKNPPPHPFAVVVGIFFCVCAGLAVYLVGYTDILGKQTYKIAAIRADEEVAVTATPIPTPVPLDTIDYDRRMNILANYPTPIPTPTAKIVSATSTATSTLASSVASSTPKIARPWPVKTVYPNSGAILPFNRIVAYYGNFYSKSMGVLGEYPKEELFPKFAAEIEKWRTADPETPVMPAIDYIAVTAQGSAGEDGKYRARMPASQIDHALELADELHGIVILEVQVGLSTIEKEVPLLEKYLAMPQVHLAIDPEFSMKTGARPGTVVGTVDATDVNWAAEYLAKLVKENNLPPKVLIIHRYTQDMLTNYKNILPLPEVQVVIDMDGWGSPERKIGTYTAFEHRDPVQFTGFKLFYKNDIRPPSTRMMAPAEVLKLIPRPIFIQYQ